MMSDAIAKISEHGLLTDWAEENSGKGKVFNNRTAVDWFIRQHRAELIRSGQLIVRRGSAGSLVGPQFERVVLDILRGESLRTLEQEAAA